MLCLICNTERPDKHFVVRGAPQGECRKCRARERSRVRMKRKRVQERLAEGYNLRVQAKVDAEATKKIKGRLRVFKMRFMRITRDTRKAIKRMQGHTSSRAIKALEVRKDVLVRYEAIYSEQVAMIKSGEMPKDIMDYM